MGKKVNKKSNFKQKNKKTNEKDKFSTRFKIEKSKFKKDKRNKSFSYSKNEKKKIDYQVHESIEKLDANLNLIQNSIRKKEQFNKLSIQNHKKVDIDQVCNAINSL